MSRRLIARTARLGALLLGAWLTIAAGCARAETNFDPVELSTSPVQLNAADPEQDEVGRLIYRGGLEISSEGAGFGGFSGLLISADGTGLLAVSDRGRWFKAHLDYDPHGRLAGLGEGKSARLRDKDGEVLKKKKWRDAESLAALEGGAMLVAFEGKHRIWLYDAPAGAPDTRPTAWPQPPGLEDVRKNSGLEALVALPNGELLALAQDPAAAPNGKAFLWRDDRWWQLTYELHGEFEPKGATRLPGGDVLVLESAKTDDEEPVVRLVRVAASDIRPGAHLQGSELSRLEPPLIASNFEAVAAREGTKGETLIYLLSDDDFDEDQRTLLLMFELAD